MYDKVLGCLLGGAIGDAVGGVAERGRACLSDDTQLTLATCESISAVRGVDPAHLAATFRKWFEERRLVGLGSSTLKALRDLAAGAHWALAGARGEMAAGNGGAMRIAPLAFVPTDRVVIRDTVRVTHHSDEAYIGALAVVEAIRMNWAPTLPEVLHDLAIALPDSRVRDRLAQVAEIARYAGVRAMAAAFGASGYVVDTVPLALAGAWQMLDESFEGTLDELVAIGGDTDTIASIAGQVAGAKGGARALSPRLLSFVPEREMIEDIGGRFAEYVETAE
jgi:ADP-ribosyl-[dinitrogen reductase] hydrolase